MIPYSTQNISKKDTTEVIKTLKSSFLTQGPKVIQFEKKISDEANSRYAVATWI
jgi:dTDP-4-amino-4,6-dideoxygalactose transaminase